MDVQKNEKLAGGKSELAATGDNNGQMAIGGTIIQFGDINGGQLNFGPAATSGNDKPAGGEADRQLSAAERMELAALRQALNDSFNQEELRDLIFDLAIEYDNLAGETKKGKARELVAYCQRHDRLAELKLAIRQRRPGAL